EGGEAEAADDGAGDGVEGGEVEVIAMVVGDELGRDVGELGDAEGGRDVAADGEADGVGEDGVDEEGDAVELDQPARVSEPGEARARSGFGGVLEGLEVSLDAGCVGGAGIGAAAAEDAIDDGPLEGGGGLQGRGAVEVDEAVARG